MRIALSSSFARHAPSHGTRLPTSRGPRFFPGLAPDVYAKQHVVLRRNSGVPKTEAEQYRMAPERLP